MSASAQAAVQRDARRLQRLHGVTLIAVTGWAQADDVRRSSDAEFDVHITQPVDYGALVQLLAQLESGVG